MSARPERPARHAGRLGGLSPLAVRRLVSLKARLVYRALHPAVERDVADQPRPVVVYLAVGADVAGDEL